jgi:serine phosphatase RsbU (regulator of sigma subunit)
LILLLCPTACALFGFAIAPHPKDAGLTARHLIGKAFLLISLCFCLRSMVFLHISLACVFLLALSLCLVGTHGPAVALGCTLLGSAVIDPKALPVFTATVLIYILLRNLLGGGALSIALIGGLACALAGGSTLFNALAPSLCCAILTAGALFALTRHSKEKKAQDAAADYQHDSTANALCAAQIRTKRLRDRLCTMSAAFGGLSEAISRADGSFTLDSVQQEEHLEQFVRDCDLITSLLRDALAEDGGHLCPDDEQAAALGQALQEAGAQFDHVICLRAGQRCRVEVHGCRPEIATKQLHRLSERITGAGLHPPVYEDGPDGGICRLRPRQRLRVQCASRSLAAGQSLQSTQAREQELLCGDTLRFFCDAQDHFYALLCDGMGSGKQAAMTSGVSVLLLERLLRAGVGLKTALTLLNQHLRTRPDPLHESSATVDLLSLDLFSGKARFVKSGAAQSFVLRDGQIYGVWGRTFPLGILSGIDVQIVPFTLQEGDCILMMSDGVGDALLARSAFVLQPDTREGGDCEGEAATLCDADRLYTLFGTLPPSDEEEISCLLDRILCAAREYGSVDDMTVALLRVVAN